MNNSNAQSNFFVITGPSGVGKDSVIEQLKQRMPELISAITTATRPMRDGESFGRPYYFISREEFEMKLSRDAFLEWANVYGNLYGSEFREIDRLRNLGVPSVFKIDIQGARTLKQKIPDVFTIFIAPQDHETLRRWIYSRGKDAPKDMERRLVAAKHELENLSEWDEVIVNEEGKLANTVDKAYSVIQHRLTGK